MKKSGLKRLWFPITAFLLFGTLAVFNYDLLEKFRTDAIDQTQRVLAYAIQIGIWLSAAHFINRLVGVVVWDQLLLRTLGAPVPRLIKDVLSIVIYVIAITGIVGVVFNKSVSAFWATSGVIGLVVGLALKNVILDVFTGLAINVDRQYKIGDWIIVHDVGSDGSITGRVEEVNWRTTRLYTEDDSIVILPNSMLGEKVVTNLWGSGPESRFDTSVVLDFSIPADRALRVLQAGAHAAIGQCGVINSPPPNVIVGATNQLGIEYKIRFWTGPWQNGNTFGTARGAIMTSVLGHLKQAGITPAYPKQDLFYAEMPTRHLNTQSLEDRAQLLAQTEIFKHLEKTDIRSLAQLMQERVFRRGERLILQGASGDSMFILSEGLLHAFVNTDGNGTELKVGQIVPGEFFGEMSLLTGEPRSATIAAVTDVIAHEITREHMSGLLQKRPAVAQIISRVVAERRIKNSQAMAAATVEERIEQTRSLTNQIMGKMKAFFKGVSNGPPPISKLDSFSFPNQPLLKNQNGDNHNCQRCQ
jgi:small-conductance mechanosensitive channel